jgi:drug/metabolite transporter (DMT)-like permease
MKEGMEVLSPYQVAALRMISAGAVLLPFLFAAIKKIEANKIKLVVLSGLLGSFFPAFLFCIAETKVDSSFAGILNSLTPLFTIVVGVSFFQLKVSTTKYIGVLVGLVGLILLFIVRGNVEITYLSYAGLVLLATLFYGINVNMVSRYLQGVGSLHIAALAFGFLIPPSLLILFFTGYFQNNFTDANFLYATGASTILGVFGTAVASIIFYMLVKRAGGIFASLVTYGIPFVAVFWGIRSGEEITLLQVGCLAIILLGVYLANKK